MTHLPHRKPLIHHLAAIAMSIAASFVVSTMLVHDAEAAPPYTFTSGGTIRSSEINANFTYLESLITASGGVKQASLVRASATITTGSSTSIYSVPGSAASPYVVRQFNCSHAQAGKCYLRVGSDSYMFDSVSNPNLLIPIAAGESLSVSVILTNGVTTQADVAVVLSK
jgi:hypothetical protein